MHQRCSCGGKLPRNRILAPAGKKDKPALEAYLLPRYQAMPRTMLRYAIEKFPEAERQLYVTGHAH